MEIIDFMYLDEFISKTFIIKTLKESKLEYYYPFKLISEKHRP